MKKIYVFLAAMLLLAMPAVAKDKKKKQDEKKPATETPAPKMEFKDGLFSVSHSGKDWYMSIPDSILGKPILAVTRYVSTPVGAGVYGGEEVNEVTVYWEKGVDDNLLLRTRVLSADAQPETNIAKAVKISSEDPIIAALKIEGRQGEGSKVKVTSLFSDDIQIFGFNSRAKKNYNLGGFKKDASFINSIRTYPINTEVTSTKTYSYQAPNPQPGQPMGNSTRIPAGQETGVVSVQLNISFLLLPEKLCSADTLTLV